MKAELKEWKVRGEGQEERGRTMTNDDCMAMNVADSRLATSRFSASFFRPPRDEVTDAFRRLLETLPIWLALV